LDGLSRVSGPAQLIEAESDTDAIRAARESTSLAYELWHANDLLAASRRDRHRVGKRSRSAS
jgi:hypothetical protein